MKTNNKGINPMKKRTIRKNVVKQSLHKNRLVAKPSKGSITVTFYEDGQISATSKSGKQHAISEDTCLVIKTLKGYTEDSIRSCWPAFVSVGKLMNYIRKESMHLLTNATFEDYFKEMVAEMENRNPKKSKKAETAAINSDNNPIKTIAKKS